VSVLLVYIAACLGFCAGFVLLGVLPVARRELGALWADIAALGALGMSDDEKERHARRAALRAMRGSGRLVLRLAGVAAATLVPVWLADLAGLADAGAVTVFALRLDVLIATTVVIVALVVAIRRLGPGRA